MSLVPGLSGEQKQILQETWTLLYEQIDGKSGDLHKRWTDAVPAEKNADAATIGASIRQVLFDLAAFDDMDHTLLRFLRARKYNKVESVKMITNALVWRKKVDVRDIMRKGESGLEQRYVNAGMYFIWGHDHENRPIVYLNVGNFLPAATAEEQQQFTRYLIYQMEVARFFIGTKGVLGLGDLTQFGRKNIDMDFSRIFADMFQSYYPEILGKAVVIGTGLKMALFETFWAVAKFFLDPVVRAKISFQKPKDLPKLIDPVFIPKSLDGKFEEQKIRQQVPPAQPLPAVDLADLERRQVAAMAAFEAHASAVGDAQRDATKAELKKLWLEMVRTWPQNLYQRLGLIADDGEVNWSKVTATA